MDVAAALEMLKIQQQFTRRLSETRWNEIQVADQIRSSDFVSQSMVDNNDDDLIFSISSF